MPDVRAVQTCTRYYPYGLRILLDRMFVEETISVNCLFTDCDETHLTSFDMICLSQFILPYSSWIYTHLVLRGSVVFFSALVLYLSNMGPEGSALGVEMKPAAYRRCFLAQRLKESKCYALRGV